MNALEQINLIKEELDSKKATLENTIKYFDDFLSMSLTKQIDYQNPDIFLDYMNYTDYIDLVSTHFKSHFHQLQEEITKLRSDIKLLQENYNEKLNQVINASFTTTTELRSLGIPLPKNFFIEKIPALVIYQKTLYINPLIKSFLSSDTLFLLTESILNKIDEQNLSRF